MHQVPAGMREIRTSLMLRNELAQYTARQRVAQERSQSGHGSGAASANDTGGTTSETKDRVTNAGRQLTRVKVVLEDPHLEITALGRACGSSKIAPPTQAERLPILPPAINNPLECGKCYVADTCMLYRRVSYCECVLQSFDAAISRQSMGSSLAPGTRLPSCTERRSVI